MTPNCPRSEMRTTYLWCYQFMRPWKKWWNQSKTGSQTIGSQLSLTEQTDWVIDYPACRFSCFYLADFGNRAWVGVLQIQFTWSEGWKRSSKGPIRSPEILKGKYFASVELDQQAWWSFLLILTVDPKACKSENQHNHKGCVLLSPGAYKPFWFSQHHIEDHQT